MKISFSYDYEDLIEEFECDILEFDIGRYDEIRVIREIRHDLDGYYPIIDYLFEEDELREEDLPVGIILEFMTSEAALDEMKRYNAIF